MSKFTVEQEAYEKKRLTLAVDFDSTIAHVIHFPDNMGVTFVNKLVHAYIRYKKRKGWVIILNTLREPHKGLPEALEFCKQHNIPIDYVNENVPEEVELWGDSRKISARRTLDDTAIGFIGWMLRTFG